LSLAAMRAALSEVLTPEAFAHATEVTDRLRAGIEAVIAEHQLPWHALQLGCRVEYRFVKDPPSDGTTSRATLNSQLERVMHLYALNRGILITPFHNMLLACPATTRADADLHTQVFDAAVTDLFG
jgi:glutamate-1-semialdehyde 2,1-aminomutase